MKLNESIPVEGVSPMAFRQPVGTHAHDRTAPLVLPPKTSLEVFRQFMQRIEDIVGTENATVVSSDDELRHEDYKDPVLAVLPLLNETTLAMKLTANWFGQR